MNNQMEIMFNVLLHKEFYDNSRIQGKAKQTGQHQNLIRYNLLKAVVDLGGAVGGNCPPLHDENSAWRPLFAEKCAPRCHPLTLLFKFRDQNVGQM